MTRHERSLRGLMSEYTKRSTPIALSLFVIDIVLLGVWVSLTLHSGPTLLKILFAVLAGDRISALFVIGHDAAHGAYTNNKRLNQLIGRIAFLPSLHNYSLWQIAHNRKHHRHPNLKGLNSWSPLSYAEYQSLSAGKRVVQRIYRTPFGLGPYYILNRWLPDKFYPTRRIVGTITPIFWIDFAVLVGFLVIWLSTLAYAGGAVSTTTPWQAVAWGCVVPFVVWNYLAGFAVYLQHTNERVPWFRTHSQWRTLEGQHQVTCHVAFPGWFNLMTHNIMEHTAHHIHPKVPLYQLRKAQKALAEALGERFIYDKFTFQWFLRTMRTCKLYDYERHQWLDFEGRPNSPVNLQAPSTYPA